MSEKPRMWMIDFNVWGPPLVGQVVIRERHRSKVSLEKREPCSRWRDYVNQSELFATRRAAIESIRPRLEAFIAQRKAEIAEVEEMLEGEG